MLKKPPEKVRNACGTSAAYVVAGMFHYNIQCGKDKFSRLFSLITISPQVRNPFQKRNNELSHYVLCLSSNYSKAFFMPNRKKRISKGLSLTASETFDRHLPASIMTVYT